MLIALAAKAFESTSKLQYKKDDGMVKNVL
jgi:hypothetical protein